VRLHQAAEPRRRRLLMAVPAVVAAIGLSAACNQASSPAAKSQAEQSPPKPADAKPADAKPAEQKPAAAGAKPASKTYSNPPPMSIDQNKK